jgi:hypothetical protein
MRYIDNWADMTAEERETTQRIIAKRNAARLKKLRGGALSGAAARMSDTFLHGGFTVAFRRKAAAPGYEQRAPLLLVHPVGIGLSSWFFGARRHVRIRRRPAGHLLVPTTQTPPESARRARVPERA